MKPDTANPTPERHEWPVRFHAHASPHISGCGLADRIYLLMCLATIPPLLAGMFVFGWKVSGIVAAAGFGAVITDMVFRSIRHLDGTIHLSHSLAIGLMLGLILPPHTSMMIALLGGFMAIAIGKWMLGSLGNYVWPPVLIGWVCLGLFFPTQITPEQHAFLTQRTALTGSLDSAVRDPGYRGYTWSIPYPGVEAWIADRPVDALSVAYLSPDDPEVATPSVGVLLRDVLPPWSDTLWGTVGGSIGCTSTLAILLSSFLLLYFSRLIWEIPIFSMLTIIVLSLIWPVYLKGSQEPAVWFPILYSEFGIPIGSGLVLYHLTGGGVMIACWLIALDPVVTPLTRRGQLIYGVLLGGLIFILRVNGLSVHSAFWALLILSPLVPMIDRFTRRRVYGT